MTIQAAGGGKGVRASFSHDFLLDAKVVADAVVVLEHLLVRSLVKVALEAIQV